MTQMRFEDFEINVIEMSSMPPDMMIVARSDLPAIIKEILDPATPYPTNAIIIITSVTESE